MNEELEHLSIGWERQYKIGCINAFECAVKEAYRLGFKAGRDAQRESDIACCYDFGHDHPDDIAKEIRKNTGDL